MTSFTNSKEWADVIPIPQDDGPGHPLAAIAYTEEYSEAMSYLRAVMAANEMSERVLDLTEAIIRMNPAHYTVWLYRARVVFSIQRDLVEEIEWLNAIALRHQKNYQIWHHRQTIIDKLGSASGEQDFLAKMFEMDTKNYHVWSYRQWLVKRFALWDAGELEATDALLREDVRNNSAWNHRWFVTFGRGEEAFEDVDAVRRELDYAKSAIRKAPQNQSPWNYIRGLTHQTKNAAKVTLASLEPFASEFASINHPDSVRSSHALDLLADIYAAEQNKEEEAGRALDLLANRYDPIRENYWRYKKGLLREGKESVGVVAA